MEDWKDFIFFGCNINLANLQTKLMATLWSFRDTKFDRKKIYCCNGETGSYIARYQVDSIKKEEKEILYYQKSLKQRQIPNPKIKEN